MESHGKVRADTCGVNGPFAWTGHSRLDFLWQVSPSYQPREAVYCHRFSVFGIHLAPFICPALSSTLKLLREHLLR